MSTRAQILAEIAAQFPDNNSGLITPAKLRQVVEDITNSYNNSTDEGTPAAAVAGHNADAGAHIIDTDLSGTLTKPGYVTTSGAADNTDSHWLHSDALTVSAGQHIAYEAIGQENLNTLSFYDADGLYLSGLAKGDYELAPYSGVVIVPAGATSMRLCGANPAWAEAAGFVSVFSISRSFLSELIVQADAAEYLHRLRIAPTSPRRLKLVSTNKIMLYGDSISSEDYPWYKSAMEELTGAIVYNGGFSGHSTADLAANAALQRIWDYGADVCVVLPGGNDTGAAGTVGSFDGSVPGEEIVTETSLSVDYNGTTFIQACSHIIRKFKAQYENIRIRAALTGAETEAQKTTKIDAVVPKPMLVFCTPLPQKRNNAADTFSIPANWQRKRDAVVECCFRYGVHCVDLCVKSGVDMSLEPYWVLPTDKVTNNGVLTMDGLHPNKWGYQIVAEIICAETGI